MGPNRFFLGGSLVAALGVVALVSTGCKPSSGAERADPVEQPDTVAQAARPPGYVFTALPRLVATSEIVVLGTVQSASKGERVVADDVLFNRDVVVRVAEQFYGPPLGAPAVVVHEGGYDGDVSYELRGLPWLRPGDRAVYFLAHPPDAPKNHYEIVGPPGRLLIHEDGTVSTKATDPVARELNGRPWSVVAEQIRLGARTAAERDVEPLPPGPFGPR